MTKETSHKTNLVFFYSEGAPNDNALDLCENKQLVLDAAKDHVDNISYYTPKKLRDLGFEGYVREYDSSGLVSQNPGMSKIGFCAWRPLILLLEMERMNEGDILIYRDSNILKYRKLSNYNDIKNIAEQCLTLCGFDFFIPHHDSLIKNRELTKTNIIRELGEDNFFSYEYPALQAAFIVIRKSEASIQLLQEWLDACSNEEWINGKQYGELDSQFHHSTPEQAILSIIIANWVRKGIHNIPVTYPLISIRAGRDINKITFRTDFSYLTILNKSNAEYINLPSYINKKNIKGLLEFSSTLISNFLLKKNYEILKSYNKIKPSKSINDKIISLREKLGKE
ncbi:MULTISPECIES: hypothetical protein [unclassified Photobacterium]|uniref:hypothetical protein n=1 Tax=unclassified Photobacterium TaxID=2628852 RepID=UPI000D15AD13|nr:MULTISPECIES: hypothetical protein [unclassified Photobacterium]PSV25019.1 hypothetical protein C9J42_17105 [Photobacterium sp. GB-56]PSV35873.1 hypothetical protein C9J38_14675 [Photobacterium sp. GB-210]